MGNKNMTPAEIEATRERLRNFAKNGFDSPSDDEEQENQEKPDLETCKPKIIEKLKEYIEEKLSDKEKKKHAKLLKNLLSASADKISFGVSPTYEMGYVYGNVSAKAKNYIGDTTYYKTIAVDLQTPEKPFFKDGGEETCFKACAHFGKLGKAAMTLLTSDPRLKGKYTWAIYRRNDEDKALNDYAIEVCKEQFNRIDYELTDVRVNDYEYVRTEPLKDCHFYPVYVKTTNSKGKEFETLIGYYDADADSMDCDINFHEISTSDLFQGLFWAGIFFVPPIVAVIVVILWLLGIVKV